MEDRQIIHIVMPHGMETKYKEGTEVIVMPVDYFDKMCDEVLKDMEQIENIKNVSDWYDGFWSRTCQFYAWDKNSGEPSNGYIYHTENMIDKLKEKI